MKFLRHILILNFLLFFYSSLFSNLCLIVSILIFLSTSNFPSFQAFWCSSSLAVLFLPFYCFSFPLLRDYNGTFSISISAPLSRLYIKMVRIKVSRSCSFLNKNVDIRIHQMLYLFLWFLSLRIFGLLSSSLLFFSQRFGRYVLRPSSGVCRTREPSRYFELRPLLTPRRAPVLIPLAITGYKC